MPVKGGYLLLAGGGAVLLYSGIKGKGFSAAFRDIISGKPPSQSAQANAIQGVQFGPGGTYAGGSIQGYVTGKVPSGATKAAYKAYAMTLLVAHGWGGQWNAFNSVEMAEAGWNNNIRNPSSGAYGIAQALGHGNANTIGKNGENNYGNYGTPDVVCRAANNGNGMAQIMWMMNYIKDRWGSPDAAWANEQQNHWY